MGIEGSQAEEEADVIRTDRLAFPVQIVKPTASTVGLVHICIREQAIKQIARYVDGLLGTYIILIHRPTWLWQSRSHRDLILVAVQVGLYMYTVVYFLAAQIKMLCSYRPICCKDCHIRSNFNFLRKLFKNLL